MVSPPPSVNVLILAGGQSRRMGQDKALILWQGISLLERCSRVALAVGDRCDIVTPWPDRYQVALPADLTDHLHWCPDPAPGAGPPRAIAHLLTIPPSVHFQWTLILACDMPNLSIPTLLTWRSHLNTLSPETLGYIPHPSNQWEPLCGFYRPSAGPSLQTHLDQGGRSLQHWLSTAPIAPIPTTPADLPLFHNCNTPQDIMSAP